jgi:BRCT domain type II-containing protein
MKLYNNDLLKRNRSFGFRSAITAADNSRHARHFGDRHRKDTPRPLLALSLVFTPLLVLVYVVVATL